ncbi:MAG: hypothetical protein PVF43_08425, partial [Candidatus Eiseniibacteriota bacterium]
MKAADRSVLALLILTVALGTMPWTAPAEAKSNLNRMREKAEEFTSSWLEADYQHRFEGKEAKIYRVLNDFGYLFSTTKISDIEDEKQHVSDPTDIRAHEMLADFIEENILRFKLAALLDDIHNFMLDEEVELLDGKHTLRAVRTQAATEPDRRARKLAYVSLADKYTIANVYKNQIIANTLDFIREIGYTDYAAMRSDHQQIDYAQLGTFCDQLLAETAAVYEQGLARQAEQVLDEEFDKVRRYDLEFLTLSSEMDATLDKVDTDRIVGQLRRTLGLPEGKRGKKIYEVELKGDEKRQYRGDVFGIDLDKKIIAAGRTNGATADLVFELESLGRVSRLITIATPQWEFRRLASRPIDLAAGYLFASLLTEPAFNTDVLGLSEADAARLARSRRFADLLDLRLDATSFMFQRMLYEDFKLAQPKYNPFMEEHLKIKLLTIDSEFY